MKSLLSAPQSQCAASASSACGYHRQRRLPSITEEEAEAAVPSDDEDDDEHQEHKGSCKRSGAASYGSNADDRHEHRARKRTAEDAMMADTATDRQVRQRKWNPYAQPLWGSPENFAAAFDMVIAPNHQFRLPLTA